MSVERVGVELEQLVDAAQERFEEADRAREERGSAVVERRAALQSSREALLARAVKLLPDCRSWEILSGEGYLDRAAERFRQALAEAEARCEEAEARVQRRNALKKRRDELSAEAVRLGGELEELRTRLQEAETAAAPVPRLTVDDLRRAVVLSEILGKPKALRRRTNG